MMYVKMNTRANGHHTTSSVQLDHHHPPAGAALVKPRDCRTGPASNFVGFVYVLGCIVLIEE